jgi:hypothetical protein
MGGGYNSALLIAPHADQTVEPLAQSRGLPAIRQTIWRIAERIFDRLPPRRLSSLL